MYNNEVTYAKEHETEANKKAHAELERKYFNRSECGPDCPISWAPEVLEMMNTLEKYLGFAYNENSNRGYRIQGKWYDWFIIDPIMAPFRATKYLFSHQRDYSVERVDGMKPPGKSFLKKLKAYPGDMLDRIMHSLGYGLRSSVVRYINPIRNRIKKPKIRLGQIKEKYGSLRCYFTTDPVFEEYMENEIRKCEIKLALKGVYSPIESFWEAGVSYNIENEFRPDSVTVTYGEYNGKRTVSLKKTLYRQIMKEMGVDLEALQQKIFEDNVLKSKDPANEY